MTKKQKIATAAVCLALVAVFFTGGYFYGKYQKFLDYRADKTPLPTGFTYTAHTGCVDTAENSLESIVKGAECGAKIVEFDLNFTADKKAVLSHDDPKGGEVTLEQAFKKLSEYETLGANVDVKNTANLAEVQELAKKYDLLDRIFYTGIKLEDVETVRCDSPYVKYFLNVEIQKSKNTDSEYIDSLVKTVSDSGVIGINFNKNSASKEIVKAFHDAGLLVSVWTADSDYDIYRILSLLPDNITTRRPDKLKRFVSDRISE